MLYNCTLKGTVSVISDDPRCKDGNDRFTMKPLCDQKFERYCRFFRFFMIIYEGFPFKEMHKSP